MGQAKNLPVEPDNEDSQAAVIKLLTKAENLFSRCNKSVKKAETQLLLGQLQKDVGKIREAKLYFNRVSHTAGESACIDLILELSPPHVSKLRHCVFEELKNLLQLICALFECKTALEEQQRLRCQEFFGLVSGINGQLHIQSCEGASIKSLLGKKPPQTGDIDPEMARQDIANHCLIPRAVNWVRWIREKLHAEKKQLTQCKRYIIGELCTKPRGTCQKLHEPYARYKLLALVSCLIQLIEIDDIVENASRLSSYPSAEKLTTEIQQRERTKFKNCRALYDVFFPEHCHQRIIGDTLPVTKEILGLVQRPVIKKQMKAFAEYERKMASPKQLRADTNLYLMCHGIYQLIGEGSKVMVDWVTREEQDCLNWQKKEGWNHPKPLGMHCLYNDSRKGYLSYKRRHLDSFDDLYSKHDAPESLKSFIGFIGTPACKPFEPLLPSISNTVAMIEAKITLALAIGAKCSQCTIAIPASYLSQAAFFDAVCCPGQGHAMYNAVKNVALFNNKSSVNHVRSLVDLICGSGKFGNKFNALADAFCSVDYINSGEAERTLVLALVMLCNAGLALPVQVIWDTRSALQTIALSDHLPQRVSTALRNVQSARSRHDALETLQELLRAREDEYLRVCVWNPKMLPRGAPCLDYKMLNVKSFRNIQYDVLPPASPTVFVEEAGGNGTQRRKEFDQEEENMLEGKGAASVEEAGAIEEEPGMGLGVSPEEAARVQRDQERLQKEKASKIIVAFFKWLKLLRLAELLRRCGMHSLTIKVNIQSRMEKSASEWVLKQLLEFVHSTRVCTICDIGLRMVQETRLNYDEQDEEDLGDTKDMKGQ